MRFRTELLPVVVALGAALPLAGCPKKADEGASVDGGKKSPIVIKSREDIPVEMGGAVAPYHPPASSSAVPPPPPGAAAPARAEGAAAPAAAPAPASASEVPAVAITHAHPPDQPCTPLERAEVEKALADLKK